MSLRFPSRVQSECTYQHRPFSEDDFKIPVEDPSTSFVPVDNGDSLASSGPVDWDGDVSSPGPTTTVARPTSTRSTTEWSLIVVQFVPTDSVAV